MVDNKGKSKIGKVAQALDGSNAIKTTFIGKALNYLGVSKINNSLLTGLLAAPAYTISFGVRAYEDSKDEGWQQAIFTELSQDILAAYVGIKTAVVAPWATPFTVYATQKAAAKPADAIYTGVAKSVETAYDYYSEKLSDKNKSSDSTSLNKNDACNISFTGKQGKLTSINLDTNAGKSIGLSGLSENSQSKQTSLNPRDSTNSKNSKVSKSSSPDNDAVLGGSFGYIGDGSYAISDSSSKTSSASNVDKDIIGNQCTQTSGNSSTNAGGSTGPGGSSENSRGSQSASMSKGKSMAGSKGAQSSGSRSTNAGGGTGPGGSCENRDFGCPKQTL